MPRAMILQLEQFRVRVHHGQRLGVALQPAAGDRRSWPGCRSRRASKGCGCRSARCRHRASAPRARPAGRSLEMSTGSTSFGAGLDLIGVHRQPAALRVGKGSRSRQGRGSKQQGGKRIRDTPSELRASLATDDGENRVPSRLRRSLALNIAASSDERCGPFHSAHLRKCVEAAGSSGARRKSRSVGVPNCKSGTPPLSPLRLTAACAAASRAIGTRKGEQDT